MAPEPPEQIAASLLTWARRHPEWHPGDFGGAVVSYLAAGDEIDLLVDPLLLGDDDPAWVAIEGTDAKRVAVLITIGYHVRSAEAVRDRLAGRAEVTIHGHPAVGKRLADERGFRPFEPGETLPGGVTAHPIGKPRRQETPLHLPSHRALAFGDAIVGTEAGARIWVQEPLTEKRERFYAERFAPTLEPLLELDFEHLLLTHGPSPAGGGRERLREALSEPPWYHRG